MNTFKKLKRKSDRYTSVLINGEEYRGYMIGDLPNKFGCLEYGEGRGISDWIKIPGTGLTYINDKYFAKW